MKTTNECYTARLKQILNSVLVFLYLLSPDGVGRTLTVQKRFGEGGEGGGCH